MKKYHLLSYLLLCCMALVTGTSCSDDDNPGQEVNDPEKWTDPFPSTDQLTVKHNNTLYYLSPWSQESQAMSDNMINRYKEAVPYTSGVKMEVGDAFFFTRQDITRIESDATLLAEFKDMFYKRSIIMMMEGGTSTDFNTVCTLLDCYNPYDYEEDSRDELLLWVFSGPLPSASGFYSKLKGTTEGNNEGEAQEMDDYGQGINCDMISQSLKDALQPKPLSNSTTNLTDLVEAYIVTEPASYSLPRYGHPEQDYGKCDNFQVQAQIWSAYSQEQKRHFHLVNLSFIAKVDVSFYGEWHNTSNYYKAYGICLTDVELGFYPLRETSGVINKYSPTTTLHQTSYTSEVSMQLGGAINTSGPELSGGVSLGNSRTITINDIDIIDKCDPEAGWSTLKWQFKLREPTSHFNLLCYASSAIDEGAFVGRNTCSLSTDFIISVADGDDAAWAMYMEPTLKAFFFKDELWQHSQYEDVYNGDSGISLDRLIHLPNVKPKENPKK